MTETVTVSNVIAIASLVSEIWLTTQRQTDTDRHGLGFFRKSLHKSCTKNSYIVIGTTIAQRVIDNIIILYFTASPLPFLSCLMWFLAAETSELQVDP